MLASIGQNINLENDDNDGSENENPLVKSNYSQIQQLELEKKNNSLFKRMEATEKLVRRCRNIDSQHFIESQAATLQKENTPYKAQSPAGNGSNNKRSSID